MRTTKAILALFALTVMPLTACSDDDDDDNSSFTITPSSVAFYHLDVQQLTVSNDVHVTWKTDDEFVAVIDQNGELEGLHVGTTLARATDSRNKTVSIPVTVLPKYFTYTEPILSWGASVSEIKSQETRTLVSEKEGSLLYEEDDYLLGYIFTDGKYTGSSLMIPTSKMKSLVGFLSERYEHVATKDDVHYYTNGDESIFIGLQVYSSKYLMVTYVEFTSSSKSLAIEQLDIASNVFAPAL